MPFKRYPENPKRDDSLSFDAGLTAKPASRRGTISVTSGPAGKATLHIPTGGMEGNQTADLALPAGRLTLEDILYLARDMHLTADELMEAVRENIEHAYLRT